MEMLLLFFNNSKFTCGKLLVILSRSLRQTATRFSSVCCGSRRQAVPAPTPRRLCREDVKLYTTMGLFGVLQPFSHFLTKMPAPLAQGSLIGFREQVLNAAKKFKQSNESSFSKAPLS